MKKYTFLIVDDENPARNKLHRFIEKSYSDAKIEDAENGIEAVKKIRENKPDVVFLDIQMPAMNGFEVIREIGSEMPPVISGFTGRKKNGFPHA